MALDLPLGDRVAHGVHLLYLAEQDGDGTRATIVGPQALLHPRVPQPHGERIHALLTRHPARRDGALVFFSDLTEELDDAGTSWSDLHIDWIGVLEALDRLSAAGDVRALHLHGVRSGPATLLSVGSRTSLDWVTPAGESMEPDDGARERLREQLAADLAADLAANGPL
jgi:hypothetical protein